MWSKKRIVWFVLSLATIVVIFYFSAQPGEKSNDVGNTVAQIINITPASEWVDGSHTELLLGLNLRKLAHIALFGVLGVSVYGWLVSVPKAILLCLAYSVFDELHQVFVPGREARGMDIFIDAVGFLTTIIMFYILGNFIRNLCVIKVKASGRKL